MAYYPPVGFHFNVKFVLSEVNENDTLFQEVSGLTAELGVEELMEGGENRFSHRLPTRAKYGNLILKRGFLKDSELIKWFEKAVEGFEFEPVNVLVTLLDEKHLPLLGWDFIRAWPVKWSVSDFKSMDNSIVVDSMELAYNYFKRV